MTRWSTRTRLAFALALVAAATGLGLGLSANAATASLLLLLAVVMAALFGRVAGGAAAVTGAIALNFFFTPPLRTLEVGKRADLFAVIAFVVNAALVGTLVTRISELRHRAERGEREARIRLGLTQRLLAGEDPAAAVRVAADSLVQLFDCKSCRLVVGDVEAFSGSLEATGVAVRVESSHGSIEVVRSQPLLPDDVAVLEALIANLGTSVERLRLEEVAREARIAAAVGRTRSGFLSAVSHNLRTPLASIKASVSTLRTPGLDLERDDRRELLETIHEEADRLERLVTKVLDLSRIRAGGLELEPQRADLGDIARAAIRRLRPIMRAHTIRLDLPDELPPVMLDVTMFEQVFLNLLENAIRFGPPGSEIRLTAREVAGTVEVRVADQGRGVAPEYRERIFDEFFQVDTRHESPGTGLGLAIVRAMVEAHDGSVWYEDGERSGATFVVQVPIMSDER